MKLSNSITDVPGIEVGQAQDDEAFTGCSVVMCRKGAVAGVDVRGDAYAAEVVAQASSARRAWQNPQAACLGWETHKAR